METRGDNNVKIEASLISDVYLLPEVIEEYSKTPYAAKVDQNRANSKTALERLQSGQCDIAVIPALSREDYDQFDIIKMGIDTLSLVVPERHFLSKKKSVKRTDISGCLKEDPNIKFLLREEGSATKEQILAYMGKENRKLLESRALEKRCHSNEEILSLISMSNFDETMLISIVSSKLTEHLCPRHGKVVQIEDIGQPREFLMLKKKNNAKIGVMKFWEFSQFEFDTKARLSEVAKILEAKIRSNSDLTNGIDLEDRHQLCFDYFCRGDRVYLKPFLGLKEYERVNDVEFEENLKETRFGGFSVKRKFFEVKTVRSIDLLGDPGLVADRIFEALKSKERNVKRLRKVALFFAGTLAGILVSKILNLI